jgi:DNA repair exonuclease SbcCD nuclease subunit
MAFEPLIRVAETGIPLYLVPGNHERSNIPSGLFTRHPNIHIFKTPQTFLLNIHGLKVSLSGFPYVRNNVRQHFPEILNQTGWNASHSHLKILCLHHCVEGATVGPANYTFRYAADVVRANDIPREFTVVLCGHIHRHQVLLHNLKGERLGAPIFFSGSLERTSFAEMREAKGFVLIQIHLHRHPATSEVEWVFHELPTRPMVQLHLPSHGLNEHDLMAWFKNRINTLPANSVVKLVRDGKSGVTPPHMLSARQLRAITPPQMIVQTHGSYG